MKTCSEVGTKAMTTKTKSGTDGQQPGVEAPELGAWQRLKARLERRMKRDEVLVAHAKRVLAGKPPLWPLEMTGITPAYVSQALEDAIRAGAAVNTYGDMEIIHYADPEPESVRKLREEQNAAYAQRMDALEDGRRARLGKRRRACLEAAERICREARCHLRQPSATAWNDHNRRYWVDTEGLRTGAYIVGPEPTTPTAVYQIAWLAASHRYEGTGDDEADCCAVARMVEQAMSRAGIAMPKRQQRDHRTLRRKAGELRCLRVAEAIVREVGAKHWMVETDGDVTPGIDYVAVPEAPKALPPLFALARAAARFRLKRPVCDIADEYGCERWAHEAMDRHGLTVPGAITAAAKTRIRFAADEALARGMEVAAEILDWCRPAGPEGQTGETAEQE